MRYTFVSPVVVGRCSDIRLCSYKNRYCTGIRVNIGCNDYHCLTSTETHKPGIEMSCITSNTKSGPCIYDSNLPLKLGPGSSSNQFGNSNIPLKWNQLDRRCTQIFTSSNGTGPELKMSQAHIPNTPVSFNTQDIP
jgi:hypothetical protein